MRPLQNNTIFWYDYETFGLKPSISPIAQFAGVRTDLDLNIIDKPIILYNQPNNDFLPEIEACLLTEITPQICQERGIPEYEFIGKIIAQMSVPNTCICGFNNIKFDDEFTRWTLYRNLMKVYDHEWKNNNSRWDIINVVRMCAAMRFDGLVIPTNDEGQINFKLENLTRENNITHSNAHDAMADVYATIEIAKLIKNMQPKLYDYFFYNRNKKMINNIMNLSQRPMLVHSSSKFFNKFYNTSIIVPLDNHPVNKNSIICYDLRYEVDDFLSLPADECKKRLYTKIKDLPDNSQRIALKAISINQAPVVAPISIMQNDPKLWQRINLDKKEVENRYNLLLQNIKQILPKIVDIYSDNNFDNQNQDVEQTLYGGGFISDNDYNLLSQFRADPTTNRQFLFQDNRLEELTFRYQAKYYPNSLAAEQQQKWDRHRLQKMDKESYVKNITDYKNNNSIGSEKLKILDDLQNWCDEI